MRLLNERKIDILFANQVEAESLAQTAEVEQAVAALRDKVETLIVTRHEHGALATRSGERADCPAAPITALIDTTGAGDLFAAGFLAGRCRGRPLKACLETGALAAAEIISHFGARPEADLKELAGL